MYNDWTETDDWRQEIAFRRWLKDQGVTPYSEARKWRRRFWWALLIDVVLSILLLIMAGSR